MSNSTNTSIQKAQSEHYKSIADIYNEYIAMGTVTMDESLKTEADISAWVEKFNEREALFVHLNMEKVIGWGIIKRYSDREGYRFVCETAVYFTQSELQKGYGSQMKKYLIERCKELNYHHLVAKIFANNQSSIHYNLNQGYTIVGTQKEIGFKNGKWQDVVIMQLILNS